MKYLEAYTLFEQRGRLIRDGGEFRMMLPCRHIMMEAFHNTK
jgi:hypothetical protein